MSDRTPSLPADRRTVLRAAGLLALTGGSAALAACSADAGTPAPALTSAPANPAAPASSASVSASPTPKPAPSPTKAKVPVPKGPGVATSKVPVGGGVILDDADYVITQPKKGEYKAFSKICTHAGCPVSKVTDGDIVCNCHGSRFSIRDGSVTNPPAGKPLKEAKVVVAGGKVVVDA